MAKKKQILYPVVFMVLVSAIFTFALALINELTIDRIHALEDTKQKKTILYVFGIDTSENQDEINRTYNQFITEKKHGDGTVYEATKEGQLLGYAFEISGPGLWGNITGYTAVSQDFTKMLGIDFIAHSETPGLGGRITESWFKEQFRNIPIASDNSDIVIYRPAPSGNVDAITGATLTSDSVKKLINEDVRNFINTMEGGI